MAREVIEVTPLVTKQTPPSHQQHNLLYHTLKVLGLVLLWCSAFHVVATERLMSMM